MLTAEELRIAVTPVEPVAQVGPYEMDDEGLVERYFPVVSELLHDAGCRGITDLIDDTACLVAPVPVLVCAVCEHAILLDLGRRR